MNWTIKYGEKPMSKKPNRQIKVQYYRSAKMGFSKGTHTYAADGTYVWGVRIDIADHNKGYTFLDQNGFSIKFESLEKAKEYADGVVKEVIEFLDKEDGDE